MGAACRSTVELGVVPESVRKALPRDSRQDQVQEIRGEPEEGSSALDELLTAIQRPTAAITVSVEGNMAGTGNG